MKNSYGPTYRLFNLLMIIKEKYACPLGPLDNNEYYVDDGRDDGPSTTAKKLPEITLRDFLVKEMLPPRPNISSSPDGIPYNVSEIYYAYIELLKLAKSAYEEIESHPDLTEHLNGNPAYKLPDIIENMELSTPLYRITAQINQEIIVGLNHCVFIIALLGTESAIEVKDIDSLKDDVNQLIKDISDSDLPKVLKNFIADQLYIIQRSINFYKMNGADGLKDALAHIMGMFAITGKDLSTEIGKLAPEKQTEMKSYTDRFFDIVTKIDTVVSVATRTQALLGTTLKLLGWNKDQTP